MKILLSSLICILAACILTSCDPKIESSYYIENLSNETIQLEIKTHSYYYNLDLYLQPDSSFILNDTLYAFKTLTNSQKVHLHYLSIYGRPKHMPKFKNEIKYLYSLKITGKSLTKDFKSEANWVDYNSTNTYKEYIFQINETDIQ